MPQPAKPTEVVCLYCVKPTEQCQCEHQYAVELTLEQLAVLQEVDRASSA